MRYALGLILIFLLFPLSVLAVGEKCENLGQALENARYEVDRKVGRIELEEADYAPRIRGKKKDEFVKRLEQLDLVPYRKVQAGNVTYTVSDAFRVQDNRPAVIAIVEVNGKKYTRVYYGSNSQGNFRLLPSVNKKGFGLPGFDKAGNEHILGVPDELDQFLAGDVLGGKVRDDVPVDILEDAVVTSSNMEEWATLGNAPAYVRNRVETRELLPEPIRPGFDLGSSGAVRDPRDVRIAVPEARPDFSQPTKAYKVWLDTSGEVDALVYRSRDGKLDYTVFKDSDGKIWFGKIRDASAPTNSWGVSEVAIDAGDLLKPRWERELHVPYEFRSNSYDPSGKYTDTWNYLRELPEVQEWYRVNKLPVPGPIDPSVKRVAKAHAPPKSMGLKARSRPVEAPIAPAVAAPALPKAVPVAETSAVITGDDLAALNRLIGGKEKLSLEEAAMRTEAGKRAAQAGYTKAIVDDDGTLQAGWGPFKRRKYKQVTVRFVKP